MKALVLAILTLLGAAVFGARAQESQASICANRVTQFVADLDQLLAQRPRSVMTVKGMMAKYLPVSGCDISGVIAIAKTSKFFSDVFEIQPSYTIIFRSPEFLVTFGLRKDTGDIQNPSARVRGYLLYD